MAVLSVMSAIEQPLVGLALTGQPVEVSSKFPLSENVSPVIVRLPRLGTYGDNNAKHGKMTRNQRFWKASSPKQHSNKIESSTQRFNKALIPTKPLGEVETVSKDPISFRGGPAVVNLPIPQTPKKVNSPAPKGKRGKWTSLPLRSGTPVSSSQSAPVLGSGAEWVAIATAKLSSGTIFSASSYHTSATANSAWTKVATTSPGSHNLTEKNFPGLPQRSGGKKSSALAKQSVPNAPLKACNTEQFPLGHFPSLGANAPAEKNPHTEWEPEGHSEWDGTYVTTKTLADIAREKQREEEDRRYWVEFSKKEEAKKRAAALERERRRHRALKIAEDLRVWGKIQFCLPKELWIQVLMLLHSTDRKSFMLTCKDAHGIFSELVTVWDVTQGYFDESVKPGKAAVGSRYNPTTQHSVTIVKANRQDDKKGYIRHEITMTMKMSIALYHMGDHFRHLEFHSTPLLTMKMLRLLLPELRNLNYLGIFHCNLLDVGHTQELLYYIRAGNRKHDVQLDYYPSTNLLYYAQIQFSVAIPALLYKILPQSLAQNARLMEPGRAFPQWLQSCHLRLSTELLEHIEQNLQDELVLTAIGTRKYQGSKSTFDQNSNEAKTFDCRSCQLKLRGCFFAKAQISGTNGADPLCWGCRLLEEIRFETTHDWGFIDQFNAVDKAWLNDSFDVQTMLRIAHEHVNAAPNPKQKPDITFAQKFRDREEAVELERLVKKGVIKRGQKSIPGSKNWAKPRKSARYNSSYKEYVEL